MKVRRGEFAPAAVSLPQYLRAQGLTHVVAPMGTRSGEAGHAMGGYRILLYPFHGGGNLWSRGLTDRQWIEYGQFLGKLHSIVPSPRIESILPVENYSTTAPARVHARSAEAAVSDVLDAFWQRYGARGMYSFRVGLGKPASPARDRLDGPWAALPNTRPVAVQGG